MRVGTKPILGGNGEHEPKYNRHMTSQQPHEVPTIAVVGAGSMGRAIVVGLLASPGAAGGNIRLTNRTARSDDQFAEDSRIRLLSTDADVDANRIAVTDAGIVIVAVKPAMVPAVLNEIVSALRPDAIVVSVAAGVTVEAMERALPAPISVLRAMPNTPALVGRALTGLSAGTRSTESDLEMARALFETVGDVLVVPENQLDALSTISGSGPAYVFYLIEQLTASAIDKGFSPADAALLVNATFRGSAELIAQSRVAPAALRKQVTSPNGTTERAVSVLETGNIK